MQTVDISNYTGPLHASILQAWQQTYHIEHVIVRLSLETAELQALAAQQLAQCQAAGVYTSGYIWCYWRAADPVETVQQALGQYPGLTAYFLDVEDRQHAFPAPEANIAWLARACEALTAAGVRFGLYTARAFWQERLGDTTAFAALPLWVAQWDQIADWTHWTRFGGWTTAVGKQYAGDRRAAGVAVDFSVFDPAWVQEGAMEYVYPFTPQATYGRSHWDGALAVDVFDAYGAPIRACTRGVATVREYPLGGHTVTLQGDDGYVYYHAHLVPGSGVGGRVRAGHVIGRVGTSGNAAGKPPHCHFAIGSAAYGIDANGAGDQPPWEWLDAWRQAVPEPAPEPAPPPTWDDLVNLLGYLQGDVAQALGTAAADLYRAARARDAAGREAAYQALCAALQTLRTAGQAP